MITTPIPKRLKAERKKVGISQKNLGIDAGMDEFVASARMNQYETGIHVPDYPTLQAIADELDLPACFFYADDDQLAELIRLYSRLKKHERHNILKLVRRLSSE